VKQLRLETGGALVGSPLPRPPRSLLWSDELAVEAPAKLLRVLTFTKAVDIEPNCIAIDEMPARTDRHALAELLNANPIGTSAAVCGNGNLVRPLSVDHSLAELSFAIDHGALRCCQ
jgi:hypothetical protein